MTRILTFARKLDVHTFRHFLGDLGILGKGERSSSHNRADLERKLGMLSPTSTLVVRVMEDYEAAWRKKAKEGVQMVSKAAKSPVSPPNMVPNCLYSEEHHQEQEIRPPQEIRPSSAMINSVDGGKGREVGDGIDVQGQMEKLRAIVSTLQQEVGKFAEIDRIRGGQYHELEQKYTILAGRCDGLRSELDDAKMEKADLQNKVSEVSAKYDNMSCVITGDQEDRLRQAGRAGAPRPYAEAVRHLPRQTPAMPMVRNEERPAVAAEEEADMEEQAKLKMNLRLTGLELDSSPEAREPRAQVVSILSEAMGIASSRMNITAVSTAVVRPRGDGSVAQPPPIILVCGDAETRRRLLTKKAALRGNEGTPKWLDSDLTSWQLRQRKRKLAKCKSLREGGVKAFFEDHRLMSFQNGQKVEVVNFD